MTYFLYYLALANVFGLAIMFVDKFLAVKHKWRISERTLILTAVFGGSLGAWIGMYCAHHKTRKLKFFVGIPVILAIQVALAVYIYTTMA